MALTADQFVILRAELGDKVPPSDVDLDQIYTLRGGLVGVVRHVWQSRLAALLNSPASFAVSGEYSQSTSANIAGIQRRLLELAGIPDDSDEIPPNTGGEIMELEVVPLTRTGQDR